MGTVNATLLLAVPNTNWVVATFSWVTAKRLIQLHPPPGWIVSSVLQRATSFLLPGESYLLPFLKRLGATR
jgi:hypothetical protein